MKDNRGLTLLEVIISVAIMSILVMAVFSMFGTGIVNIARAGDRTDAVLEAQTEINEAIKYPDGDPNVKLDGVDVEIPGVIDTTVSGKTIVREKSDMGAYITTFVPDPN